MKDTKPANPTEPLRINSSDWVGWRGKKWSAQLNAMQAMIEPIDEALFDRIDFSQPIRVADLGCGGGATTCRLGVRLTGGSCVEGIDISADLLALARGNSSSGENPVSFIQADLGTDTPCTPYDLLVSRFGVMFFPNAPQAFKNLRRWLKPGGRFTFAVWGRAADNPAISGVRRVLTQLIELPERQPDQPGPFRYGEVEVLLRELRDAGFIQLRHDSQSFVLPVGGGVNARDAAEFCIRGYSDYEERLAKLGEKTRARAVELLSEMFCAHEKNGAVRMNARVHFVSGFRA